MQNNMPITAKWSRSKPEVDVCFSKPAVNGDMSTKFGLLIGTDVLKALTSTNTKPEIVLSGGDRHVAKSI